MAVVNHPDHGHDPADYLVEPVPRDNVSLSEGVMVVENLDASRADALASANFSDFFSVKETSADCIKAIISKLIYSTDNDKITVLYHRLHALPYHLMEPETVAARAFPAGSCQGGFRADWE
jgi:hypothetical protein